MSESFILRGDGFPFVRNAGYGEAKKMWQHPRRCLDFHVFLYILSGQFQVCEEGVEYVLQPGEVFFLSSHRNHWGELKTPPGTSWYWIHFHDPPYASTIELKELVPGYQPKNFFHTEDYCVQLTVPKKQRPARPEIIKSRLKKLIDICNSKHPLRAMQAGLLTAELWMELYQQGLMNERKSRTDMLVGKILLFLESSNLSEKFSAGKVAAHFNMNYNYLSSLFKEKTGVSISKYFTRLRINRSMELLKIPELNVSEISQRLGFSSPYHFSRVFKLTNGVSPSEYMTQIYRSSEPENRV